MTSLSKAPPYEVYITSQHKEDPRRRAPTTIETKDDGYRRREAKTSTGGDSTGDDRTARGERRLRGPSGG